MSYSTSPRYGGTLTVVIPFDAHSFNVAHKYFSAEGGYFVANNIFNRLVVLDVFGEGGIGPELASSWQISSDGTRYTFNLRRDVRWHDGAPFTSADVKYTYETVLAHRYDAHNWLQDIRAVHAPDPYRVAIELAAPNAAFLTQISMFSLTHILPRHLYAGTDWATNPHNECPVGTGPFRFVDWQRGDRIILESNPDYFGGQPYLDQLIYKVIGDEEESIQSVVRGDAGYSAINAKCSAVDALSRMPGVAVLFEHGHDLEYITFNLNGAKRPWHDGRVRRAVACAIDRSEYLARVCSHSRRADTVYLPHITWAHNPDARMPEFAPQLSEALLDEAGLPRAADGVRLRARLSYRANSAEPRAGEAKLICEQLARIGIQVQPSWLTPEQWRAQVMEQRDFDLLLDDGDIGPDPDIWWVGLGYGNARNYAGYTNPEVERLFAKGRRGTDQSARGQAYRRIQTILADELPRISIMMHGEHMLYRAEYEGFSWLPGIRGTVPFWNCSRVWWTQATRANP